MFCFDATGMSQFMVIKKSSDTDLLVSEIREAMDSLVKLGFLFDAVQIAAMQMKMKVVWSINSSHQMPYNASPR